MEKYRRIYSLQHGFRVIWEEKREKELSKKREKKYNFCYIKINVQTQKLIFLNKNGMKKNF